MKHLRVNIGHNSWSCFHHFDNEQRMFQWISNRIGQQVSSYADCEEWTKKQNSVCGPYIEILTFKDVRGFYSNRRKYMEHLDICNNIMERAQRRDGKRRANMLQHFSENYNAIWAIAEHHPEVWQGEV